jgi:hypothetical protein
MSSSDADAIDGRWEMSDGPAALVRFWTPGWSDPLRDPPVHPETETLSRTATTTAQRADARFACVMSGRYPRCSRSTAGRTTVSRP